MRFRSEHSWSIARQPMYIIEESVVLQFIELISRANELHIKHIPPSSIQRNTPCLTSKPVCRCSVLDISNLKETRCSRTFLLVFQRHRTFPVDLRLRCRRTKLFYCGERTTACISASAPARSGPFHRTIGSIAASACFQFMCSPNATSPTTEPILWTTLSHDEISEVDIRLDILCRTLPDNWGQVLVA